MRHSFLLLLAGVFFFSCTNDPIPGEVPTIFIDPESAQETADWQSVLDTTVCDIVVLETTPECVIGKIDKIFFTGDTIIVCDTESMSVLLFDKNGKYLSKINKVGRSRQEYLSASDFYLKDGFIWILDQSQYKVIQYSLNGNYITSFQFGDGFTFAVLDSLVVFDRGWGASYLDNVMLEVRDLKGELKGLHIETTSKDANLYKGGNTHELFFNVKDNCCDVLAPSKDIVFHYENGIATLKYLVDFGTSSLPLKMKKKGVSYLAENNIQKEDFVLNVNRVVETDRYRIISFDYKKGVYFHFYDKQEDKIAWFSRNWRDFKEFGLLMGNLYFDGNNVIYNQPAFLMKAMVENHDESEFTGRGLKLYNLAKNIKGDDNNVIVRLKLKE